MVKIKQPQVIEKKQHRTFDRWGEDFISLLPKSSRLDERCLEFGCGNGQARNLIEEYGYNWTGIDISGNNVSARCDGHYLPFADQAFSLVVSVAVFEHLYDPFAAAREVYRVLEPGGTFLGTTAFLEPFHANSYFHMSHLGVQQVLTRAGFVVRQVWPTWHFIEATTGFWFPSQLPIHQTAATLFRWAAKGNMFARVQALRWYLNTRGIEAEKICERIQREQLTWTGAIGFLVSKPV